MASVDGLGLVDVVMRSQLACARCGSNATKASIGAHNVSAWRCVCRLESVHERMVRTNGSESNQ